MPDTEVLTLSELINRLYRMQRMKQPDCPTERSTVPDLARAYQDWWDHMQRE